MGAPETARTLILSPRGETNSRRLAAAAHDEGWSVDRLGSWRVDADVYTSGVAIYGEPLFVATVAQQLDLLLIEPSFDWLPLLPVEYRGRDIRLTTLADARRGGRAFYKPADDKFFPAAVYASGANISASPDSGDDAPVIVSEVVEWEIEFRCFVTDRRVASCGLYLRAGEAVDDYDDLSDEERRALQDAEEFTNRMLHDDRVAMPPACVVDVGRLTDGRWAVVESNPAFGAGICGCDPSAVLGVIARSCVQRERVLEDDRHWIRPLDL